MKLSQINKDSLEEDKQKKIDREIILQYQKSLLFSNTQKHSNYQISENGKVITDIINDGKACYCLCDQAIPKIGKIQFAFQILSGQTLRAGISMKDLPQKNNYINCFSSGNGYQIQIINELICQMKKVKLVPIIAKTRIRILQLSIKLMIQCQLKFLLKRNILNGVNTIILKQQFWKQIHHKNYTHAQVELIADLKLQRTYQFDEI
ncbi:unnamed protein product [Paramecium octaurelia]|uniref:Uncharacterized protein n=1 Tax=Paramecium octaurelia TaxID=43137 RepID=A0A8S1UFZ1_PAROT|nr:unnamed protein product [Paramecium octaurelia]